MRASEGSTATADAVLARVVDAHQDALPGLAAAILGRLRDTVPEFFADADVAYDMATAVGANVRRFAQLLGDPARHAAAPALPHEAGDLLQSTIQHGIPLVSLLEAYRAAQGIAAAWWQERLEDVAPVRELARATRRLGDLLVVYVDAAAREVRGAYEQERRAVESSHDGRRAHLVRKLLAGELLDTDAAARTLNHPLAGRHVGLVLWREHADVPEAQFSAALDELARAAGGPRQLQVAARHRVYAWLSTTGTLDAAALHEARTPAGIRAAMSGVQEGAAGFVRAHADAARTAAAVRDRAGGDGRVAAFERLELVALLTQDPEAAHRFAARVLGPLATATAANARRRETLRVVLAAGGSPTRAAAHLGVHRNTVLYRLRGLEEAGVLPADRDWAAFADRRLELELALRLVDQ